MLQPVRVRITSRHCQSVQGTKLSDPNLKPNRLASESRKILTRHQIAGVRNAEWRQCASSDPALPK